jgi:excisionase family DNA binding protein
VRDDGLLSVREAMLLMDISTRHEFNKLIFNKALPCTMIGKHIRVAREDVDRYVGTVKVEEKEPQVPDSAGGIKLLTVREVMEILRISRATFFNLLKKGDLAYSKVGKRYRISQEDLEQYVAAHYTPRGEPR